MAPARVGIITGGLGALNLNERIEGFRETIGSDIEIVEVVATDDDLQKGLGVSEALLRAHPDLNGVACVSATGGPTLAQVIQGPEFADREVTIVAFDDLKEVLDAIEAGHHLRDDGAAAGPDGQALDQRVAEDPDPGLRPGVRPPRHRSHRGDRGEPHHLHQVGMHRCRERRRASALRRPKMASLATDITEETMTNSRPRFSYPTRAAFVGTLFAALLAAFPLARMSAAQDATPMAGQAGITSEAWGEV